MPDEIEIAEEIEVEIDAEEDSAEESKPEPKPEPEPEREVTPEEAYAVLSRTHPHLFRQEEAKEEEDDDFEARVIREAGKKAEALALKTSTPVLRAHAEQEALRLLGGNDEYAAGIIRERIRKATPEQLAAALENPWQIEDLVNAAVGTSVRSGKRPTVDSGGSGVAPETRSSSSVRLSGEQAQEFDAFKRSISGLPESIQKQLQKEFLQGAR